MKKTLPDTKARVSKLRLIFRSECLEMLLIRVYGTCSIVVNHDYERKLWYKARFMVMTTRRGDLFIIFFSGKEIFDHTEIKQKRHRSNSNLAVAMESR